MTSVTECDEPSDQRKRRKAVRRITPSAQELEVTSTDQTLLVTLSTVSPSCLNNICSEGQQSLVQSFITTTSVTACSSTTQTQSIRSPICSLPAPAEMNNQPPEKKESKKTKKSQLSTSPSEFQKEQMKIELGILRTKLKQTETELKSTKGSNDILLARHRLFEDKRLSDAFDKLFPTSPTPEASSSKPFPSDNKNKTSATSLDELVQLELLNSIRNTQQVPQIDSLIQLEILKSLRNSPDSSSSQEVPSCCSSSRNISCNVNDKMSAFEKKVSHLEEKIDKLIILFSNQHPPQVASLDQPISEGPSLAPSPPSSQPKPPTQLPPRTSRPIAKPQLPSQTNVLGYSPSGRPFLLPTPEIPPRRPFLLPTPRHSAPRTRRNHAKRKYLARGQSTRHQKVKSKHSDQVQHAANQPETALISFEEVTSLPTSSPVTSHLNILDDLKQLEHVNERPLVTEPLYHIETPTDLDHPELSNSLGNSLN